MNVLRRVAMAVSGTVVVALVLTLAAPRAAHAVFSALVTVTNTAANPVPVTGAVITNQAPRRWDPSFICSNGCQDTELTVPKAPDGSDQAYEVQYISGVCGSPLSSSNEAEIAIKAEEPPSATLVGTAPVIVLEVSPSVFSQRVDFFASSIAPMLFRLQGLDGSPFTSGNCEVTLNGRLFPETQQ